MSDHMTPMELAARLILGETSYRNLSSGVILLPASPADRVLETFVPNRHARMTVTVRNWSHLERHALIVLAQPTDLNIDERSLVGDALVHLESYVRDRYP